MDFFSYSRKLYLASVCERDGMIEEAQELRQEAEENLQDWLNSLDIQAGIK